MITWPFPQWMSLIRSHWRSHWVCNCFPLGETLTAIELHLTAEFADECTLSTEWSGLILLWVVMELLKTPKTTRSVLGWGWCIMFFWWERNCRARVHMFVDSLKWHQALNIIISHINACSTNVSVAQMQSVLFTLWCVTVLNMFFSVFMCCFWKVSSWRLSQEKSALLKGVIRILVLTITSLYKLSTMLICSIMHTH